MCFPQTFSWVKLHCRQSATHTVSRKACPGTRGDFLDFSRSEIQPKGERSTNSVLCLSLLWGTTLNARMMCFIHGWSKVLQDLTVPSAKCFSLILPTDLSWIRFTVWSTFWSNLLWSVQPWAIVLKGCQLARSVITIGPLGQQWSYSRCGG